MHVASAHLLHGVGHAFLRLNVRPLTQQDHPSWCGRFSTNSTSSIAPATDQL